MRPMMGVWMEDESTVTTVSHGMSRPNGANTGPIFFAGTMPAELSANRLMGASIGDGFVGRTANGGGGAWRIGGNKVCDDEIRLVGGDLVGGGLKTCIGLSTDC